MDLSPTSISSFFFSNCVNSARVSRKFGLLLETDAAAAVVVEVAVLPDRFDFSFAELEFVGDVADVESFITLFFFLFFSNTKTKTKIDTEIDFCFYLKQYDELSDFCSKFDFICLRAFVFIFVRNTIEEIERNKRARNKNQREQ